MPVKYRGIVFPLGITLFTAPTTIPHVYKQKLQPHMVGERQQLKTQPKIGIIVFWCNKKETVGQTKFILKVRKIY